MSEGLYARNTQGTGGKDITLFNIDKGVYHGTRDLSVGEARSLVASLQMAINSVEQLEVICKQADEMQEKLGGFL